MKIAGLGFRSAVDVASLRDALARAGGSNGVTALATLDEKAGATALKALAAELALPVYGVTPEAMAMVETLTQSAQVAARLGLGSVAEAAALVMAGPAARLLGPRVVSGDGLATAAIAEGAKS